MRDELQDLVPIGSSIRLGPGDKVPCLRGAKTSWPVPFQLIEAESLWSDKRALLKAIEEHFPDLVAQVKSWWQLVMVLTAPENATKKRSLRRKTATRKIVDETATIVDQLTETTLRRRLPQESSCALCRP